MCTCASHEDVWGTGGIAALILSFCTREWSASRSDRLISLEIASFIRRKGDCLDLRADCTESSALKLYK
jgi:hypothetical protein